MLSRSMHAQVPWPEPRKPLHSQILQVGSCSCDDVPATTVCCNIATLVFSNLTGAEEFDFCQRQCLIADQFVQPMMLPVLMGSFKITRFRAF